MKKRYLPVLSLLLAVLLAFGGSAMAETLQVIPRAAEALPPVQPLEAMPRAVNPPPLRLLEAMPRSEDTDAAVATKVAEIAAACRASGASGDYEIALWLHDWLIYNANYDETYTEYYADGVLLKGTGVCQSYMLAYELLLDAMGIENMRVTSQAMNHAWNLVKMEGEWYHVDCTWDDPVGGGYEGHSYFGLSDQLMKRDHYGYSGLPACTAEACNYMIRNAGDELEVVDITTQAQFNEKIDQLLKAGKTSFLLYNRQNYDLWDLFYTWFDTESWRYDFSGCSYSGSNNYEINLTLHGYQPDVASIMVDRFIAEELAPQLKPLLAAKQVTIRVFESGSYGTTTHSEKYAAVWEIVEAYSSLYGCSLNGGYRYADSFIILDVTYDDTTAGLSGSLNANLSWTLTPDGTLTISGTGVIPDYGYDSMTGTTTYAPWHDSRSCIEKLVIGEGVTGIGRYLLYDCQLLTSATFPASLTSSAYGAFEVCYALESVYAPSLADWLEIQFKASNSNPAYYGRAALYLGGEKLTNLVIPAGTTAVPDYAFSGVSSLTSVTFPAGLQSIGASAFNNCTGVKEISLPDGLKSIGSGAFMYLDITEINLPDSVESIGDAAFSSTDLQSVVLPDSLTTLEDDLFSGCFYLESVTLPRNLQSIGDRAFNYCNKLTEVIIPGDYTPAWTLSDLPVGFTVHCYKGSAVETWAKANGYAVACMIDPDMTKAILPADLTFIDAGAFAGSGVEYVVIPSGCTDIGSLAFANCGELLYIYMPDSVQNIALDAFTGSDNVTFICESENAAAAFAQTCGIACTIE